VASLAGPGVARLHFLSSALAEPLTVDFNTPNTGGWQSWQSISVGSITLPPGELTIRLEILSGEFNVNWIEFASAVNQSWTIY
jgi:hypothetical protein